NSAHLSIISLPLTTHHRAPATADAAVLVLRAAVAAQHRCSAAQSRGERASFKARPRNKMRREDETHNQNTCLVSRNWPPDLPSPRLSTALHLVALGAANQPRGGPGPTGALAKPSSDQA
ncbi:hypothetical protein CP532_2531, partial [Ophiocordyceps camponoti-leonardi (nom. inval.)]